MQSRRIVPWWASTLVMTGLWGTVPTLAAEKPNEDEKLPAPRLSDTATILSPSILDGPVNPIDLASALELAGVENPEILLARERVVEAAALRQLAAAQILPTINAGTNFDNHTGPLQRANGTILEVNRNALYLGLGANAVGAGTVNIPGIVWNGNLSRTYYGILVSRQIVQARESGGMAVRNDVLLRVALAYLELLRAEGKRVVALQTRDEAREVARVTTNYARTGQGRQADADRAATELEQRNADLMRAEEDILTASARLCQLLHLDPSVRLHAMDGWVVPAPIVPDPIPLPELIAIALMQRPELRERQAVIRAALLELKGAQCLPFSPNLILGYSAGEFGGGSNLVAEGIPQADGTILRQPRFDSFAGRQDLDAVVYWSLRNLGVGNVALVQLARSNLRSEQLREVEVLDRVRSEVAAAYAATHARFAQIETAERAVQSGQRAFREDLTRTRNREGLPIEVLDSLRLLGRSRYAYLDAIVDYNRAQFELYVALGQPPAKCLAHPVPAELVPPSIAPLSHGSTSVIMEVRRLAREGRSMNQYHERFVRFGTWVCATLVVSLLGLSGCQSGGMCDSLMNPASPILANNTPAEILAAARPPIGIDTGPMVPAVPAAAEQPIDLGTALVLGGADNPTIALAEEAVQASLAELLQARSLLLPTLDAGMSFNWHRGNLQSSQGIILDVDRQSLYAGAGAVADGAGTVGIPGIRLTAHLADALYEPIAAQRQVEGRRLNAAATRNTVLLKVVTRYLDLAGAEARLAALRESEAESAEVVRLTANFARTGQGRAADADRARGDSFLLHAQAQRVEEEAAVAAANLDRILSFDPSVRLRAAESLPPILQLVDMHQDLETLIEIALRNRPEIGAAAALVAFAEVHRRQEHVRPFLPLLSAGYSSGTFGGGSDQADTRFGHFNGRTDFDAEAVWSLNNLGFGNLADERRWQALAGQAAAGRARVIDQVRSEVAEAYGQSAARLKEVEVAQCQLKVAHEGFRLDLIRARNLEGLPIETLNSLNTLAAARQELIRAVIGFDQAQFRLFVAIGQTPIPPPAMKLQPRSD